VTDERPLPAQLRNPSVYPNPLDAIDGAARVLQPLWRSEALRALGCYRDDAGMLLLLLLLLL
jgi:hypothetical protein